MKRLADMLVLVGPSGCGKSTLITRLMKEFPAGFGYSISHTTRQARKGETDGVSYHFIDPSKFNQLIADGAFLEHAIVHDTQYGTSYKSIHAVHEKNRVCVMDLDIVGAGNVKKDPNLKTVVLFVEPPSMDELEKRLRARGTETEDRLQKRLANAKKEMEFFATNPSFFDAALVNDDLEKCYAHFRECVMTKCFEAPEAHSR